MADHAFTLTDHTGASFDSSDVGGPLLVFFYPKAMTPGCTAEACAFRDRYERFVDAGYTIVGISPDEPADNATFADAHSLPFPLLSDPDHAVAERFGAWGTKKNYGREYEGLIRSTFVIDDDQIAHAWRNVRAAGHVDRVARDLGLD